MKACSVLLLTAFAICFAAQDPCLQPNGAVDQHCQRMQQARRREKQCRQDSNITHEEIKEYACTLPTDPEVQERVGKYSLCSSLILRQVLPNGTLAMPKNCATDVASTDASSPKPPSRCDIWRRAAACTKEKEAEVGSSPEQRAMIGRVCLCDAQRYAALVRRCVAPEVKEEPYCVEQRRRRMSELQCKKDSGLTPRQLKNGLCKLPEDSEVKEKLAKYSVCSLLNNGQMFPNGTTKGMFAAVNCSDGALATTEAPQRRRKRQERVVLICGAKKAFAACKQGKEAALESGTEQEKKALAHQLCKCEVSDTVRKHKREQSKPTSQ